jgi:MoaA/NifB/PqqE/SkfB family radical SAM enzyme
MQALIAESYRLRRLARRVGWRPRKIRTEAPERPVGAKLELTHACNLRCGFCYTDSPRHTLQRTPDLSDEAWLSIADQAADLGVIEVVLTGGEPLLRRELVFELIERLEMGGVGLTLNTNGWFVDDVAADRLAGIGGLQVDISIDGATPGLHDASRCVPGSWRRAVDATGRLLDRGVPVQVVHVVTPENEQAFPAFLEQMWTLGVGSVRVTPVVPVGAAARKGRWAISRGRLGRAVRRADSEDMRVVLQGGTTGALALPDAAAPASLLVRPSGAVLTDSIHPFAFGHALHDGLETCWERIAAGWLDPRILRWVGSLHSSRDLPRSELVPYLDEEVRLTAPARGTPGGAKPPRRRHAEDPIPRKASAREDSGDPAEDLGRARSYVRGLALARRYRLGAVRMAGGPRDHYVRTLPSGEVAHLNGTAATIAGALDGGTPADAVGRLARRYSVNDRARLERDVLAAGRSLLRRGILVPADARRASHPAAATGRPDLPDASPGSL